MISRRPVYAMVAVVVLVGAAAYAVRYIDRIPPEKLSSLLGLSITVSDINATPTPSPRVTPAGGDRTATLGSVAVQTFAGPTLVRQGSGTTVSADGLVLTNIAAAPWGTGGYLYQVATPRGQLLRAKWAAWDSATGLVLLKAEATDLDAVFFEESPGLFAGQKLEAVAAQVLLSRFVSQRLPAWVVWASDDGKATLSLDRSLGSTFNGARLVDDSNRSVGILRYASGPVFVSTAQVNAFLESYLSEQEGQ
jgi:hypothetical protein